MTVAELKEKLDSYFERGYGECELETIDQGGNAGEVLSVLPKLNVKNIEA